MVVVIWSGHSKLFRSGSCFEAVVQINDTCLYREVAQTQIYTNNPERTVAVQTLVYMVYSVLVIKLRMLVPQNCPTSSEQSKKNIT